MVIFVFRHLVVFLFYDYPIATHENFGVRFFSIYREAGGSGSEFSLLSGIVELSLISY